MHGGTSSGGPVKSGLYSERFRRLSQASQHRIDEALQDEGLLDVRRPVALQQALVQDSDVLPDDDLVEAYARHRSKWRPNTKVGQTWADQPPPTGAEIALARMALVEHQTRILSLYSDVQARAAKAAQTGELLSKLIVPLFAELGLEIAKLAELYVDPDRRDDFVAAFRLRARRVFATIAEAER